MNTEDLRTSRNYLDHTTLLRLLHPTPTKEVVDFWRQMHQSDEPAISMPSSPYLNPTAEHPVFTGNPDEPFGTEYPEPRRRKGPDGDPAKMSPLQWLHSLVLGTQ